MPVTRGGGGLLRQTRLWGMSSQDQLGLMILANHYYPHNLHDTHQRPRYKSVARNHASLISDLFGRVGLPSSTLPCTMAHRDTENTASDGNSSRNHHHVRWPIGAQRTLPQMVDSSRTHHHVRWPIGTLRTLPQMVTAPGPIIIMYGGP